MITIREFWNLSTRSKKNPDRPVAFEGKTVADYAPEKASTAICDGKFLKPGEWATVIPKDETLLTFVHIDEGGGGGGLGSIGITSILAGVSGGSLYGGLFGLAAGAFTAGLVGFDPAGAFQGTPGLSSLYGFGESARRMVTGFLQPSIPGLAGALGSGAGSSGQYGFGSPANTVSAGTAAPFAYGRTQLAGHYLQSFRYSNADGRQIIQSVVAVNSGEVDTFGDGAVTYSTDQDNLTEAAIPSSYLINGREGSSYPNIYWSCRMGTTTQAALVKAPITGAQEYKYTILEYPQTFRYRKGADFSVLTKDAVDEVALNLIFPNGLLSAKKATGEDANFGIVVETEIRRASDDTLLLTRRDWIKGSFKYPYYRTLWFRELSLSTPEKLRIVSRRIATGYESMDFDNVDSEDNESRRRYECSIYGLLEIDRTPIAYRDWALYASTIVASDDLQGVDTPRQVITGKWKKVYNADTAVTEWSNNPAWVVRDLITSPDTRIPNFGIIPNDAAFIYWADKNDVLVPSVTGSGVTEKRHTWDGVIDTPQSAGELLASICNTARAMLVCTSNIVTPIYLEAKAAVFEFNEGNIALSGLNGPSTFQSTIVTRRGRPSLMELQFQSENDGNWENDAVYDDRFDYLDGTEESVANIGVVRKSQALRNVAYFARKAQLPDYGYQWTAGLDSIVLEPGDVVRVPEYLASGRVDEYATPVLTLDREVTFEAGVVYILRYQTEGGNRHARRFTMSAGATDEITFSPPLESGEDPGTPVHGYCWSIAEQGAPVMLAEITSLSGLSNGQQTITAIEHVAEVYSDESGAGDGGVFSSPAMDPADDAEITSVTETYVADGTSQLTVAWDAGADAVSYDVHCRTKSTDGSFAFVGSTATLSLVFNYAAVWGMQLEIAVVSVNARGERLSPVDVSGIAKWLHVINRDDEHNIVAQYPDPITAPTLTLVGISGNEYTFSWTAPGVAPDGYEVRRDQWQIPFERDVIGATNTTVYLTDLLSLYGARSFLEFDSADPATIFAVTDATNASPIVVTTSLPHGLRPGMRVKIAGVVGNTAANGVWTILETATATTLSISATGSGAYVSGGVATKRVRYYSQTFPTVLTTQAVPLAYILGSTAAEFPLGTDTWRVGTIINGNIVSDPAGVYGEAIQQVDANRPMMFSTPTLDTTAAADYFLSVDWRPSVVTASDNSDYLSSMQQVDAPSPVSDAGSEYLQANKVFSEARLYLQYSNSATAWDGPVTTFGEIELTDLLMESNTLTSLGLAPQRYFRISATISILDLAYSFPVRYVAILRFMAVRFTAP